MRDIQVLINAGCSGDVVAHCIEVSRLARSLAERATVTMDLELVQRGGLLHDIGRSRTHGIDHAIAGVEIVKQLGFSDRLADIIERHIGAGITEAESIKLGLPKKDYIPLTPEEKIVSYADNLTDGMRRMPYSEALNRFKVILGPDHESVVLFIRQHREIQGWMRERRR